MRKPVITALLVICCSLAGIAQNAPKVPMLANKALQSRFPKASPPTWKKTDDNNYVAEFKNAGDKTIAVFDDHGTFLESQKPIKAKLLPEPVKNTVGAEFKGFNTTENAVVETAAKETFYKVVVDKKTELVELRLNKEGSILKTNRTNKQ